MNNRPFRTAPHNRVTLNDLPRGIVFEPPKRFKTRAPTQLGSLLVPVKFKKRLLEYYVLITDKTEIKVFGQAASKDELEQAIPQASNYYVRGTLNSTNIEANYFSLT